MPRKAKEKAKVYFPGLHGLRFFAAMLVVFNYDTGMAVLYFMSILHVMLEFPLNHLTFAGIGKELYAMAR